MPNPNHDEHGRFSAGEHQAETQRVTELRRARGMSTTPEVAAQIATRNLEQKAESRDRLEAMKLGEARREARASSVETHQPVHQELHDKTVASPLAKAAKDPYGPSNPIAGRMGNRERQAAAHIRDYGRGR